MKQYELYNKNGVLIAIVFDEQTALMIGKLLDLDIYYVLTSTYKEKL